MNMEEAISMVKGTIERLSVIAGGGLYPEERIELLEAFAALLGPQPYPITGLVPCGCGGKLVLHKCADREYMTTFYVECDNEECGLSVGRRYDPINHCRRGEFTDTKSAIEASNRAMGYKGGAE